MSVDVTNRQRLPTQSDIAAMFGVSRMTVSRALRDSQLVRADLREKILKAARAHGYSDEAGFSARLLRQGRNGDPVATRVICTIVRDLTAFTPFQLRMLGGIKRAAEQADDDLLVVLSQPERFPRVVLRRQVDGVVWCPSEEELQFFPKGCLVPVVGIFHTPPGMDLVTVDDHGATRAMGDYLSRKGHRRVAFVGPDSQMARARLAGLRAGLAGAGGHVDDCDAHMKPKVMLADTVVPLVRAAMARWQMLPPADRFTAIAAYNDFIAVTVIRCLQDEYGLRVPRDMSVTGFDGLDVNGGIGPRLTSAVTPLEALGAEAVSLIHWRLENPQEPVRRVILHAPLMEGESVGDARIEN